MNIDIQLRWHHQFQFAGYYAALEKGFYKQEGLTVRLHAGDPAHQPVSEVLSGWAEYAEGNSEGIASSQIEIIPSSYDLNDFIAGKVDAFNSYITNEPFFLQQQNIVYKIINPLDYRVDFYSDILFTTEKEIHDHPGRVAAMRRATLKGWRYAMDHPAEIIDLLINQYHVEKSRSHLEFEAAAMRKLIFPDLIEIGHMNKGRWQHMADSFVTAGLIKPGYSLDGFIYDTTPKKLPQWVVNTFIVAVLVLIIIMVLMSRLFQLNRNLVKTETSLKESQRHLKQAQAIAHIGSWTYNQAGQVSWSDELYKIFATTQESFQLNAKEIKEMIYPDDQTRMKRWLNNILSGQAPSIIDLRCFRSDGDTFYIQCQCELIVDPANESHYLAGTAQDISEYKKLEEQLTQAQKIESIGVLVGGIISYRKILLNLPRLQQ